MIALYDPPCIFQSSSSNVFIFKTKECNTIFENIRNNKIGTREMFVIEIRIFHFQISLSIVSFHRVTINFGFLKSEYWNVQLYWFTNTSAFTTTYPTAFTPILFHNIDLPTHDWASPSATDFNSRFRWYVVKIISLTFVHCAAQVHEIEC